MDRKTILAAQLLVVLIVPAARAQDSSPEIPDTAYVPGEYGAFTGAGAAATLDDIVAEMGRHQVVFVGESHDDPTGHMLEAELLERAYAAYGAPGSNGGAPRTVALSLEFFERDVQPILDEYLGGLITERAFLADSRPWPRYETDYRKLIEFAKRNGLAVIAANAPRRYAGRVTRHGRESLNDLSPADISRLRSGHRLYEDVNAAVVPDRLHPARQTCARLQRGHSWRRDVRRQVES
jgi:uncharacterized iron-regulated protein